MSKRARVSAFLIAGFALYGIASCSSSPLGIGRPASAQNRGCDDLKSTVRLQRKARVLLGTARSDVIIGGPRAERIKGYGGHDLVCGGGGNDIITGGQGPDRLYGEAGSDRLSGGRGRDELMGGPGYRDDLRGGREGDFLDGGPGSGDSLDGGLGDDSVNGGDGDRDVVTGGGGNDRAFGAEGDGDVLRADQGRDTIDGGGGVDDVVTYASASHAEGFGPNGGGVVVNLARGFAGSSEGGDTLYNLEDAIGSSFPDMLVGNDGPNKLDGSTGNDRLLGGGGFDFGLGALGADRCSEDIEQQESCNDEALISEAPSAELHRTFDGTLVLSVVGKDLSDNLAIARETDAYVIRSTSGIEVGAGCVVSAAGARCPSPPHLTQIFGAGGTGDDVVSVLASVPASVPAKLDGGLGSDVLQGGLGDDYLDSGETGRDALLGGGGSDGLFAHGEGGDSLRGEAGTDLLLTDNPCRGHVFDGGTGEDNVSFSKVAFTQHFVARIGGLASDLGFLGEPCLPSQILASNESLEGSLHNDTLIGDGKSNRLYGAEGRDNLLGRGGEDLLISIDGERDGTLNCGPGRRDGIRRDGVDGRGVSC